MGELHVRRAQVADLDDLTVISRSVERADPMRRADVPLVERHELATTFFEFPEWKPTTTWIAHRSSDGAPVGHAVVRLPMAANRHHVEVAVEVVPEARRRGVGPALLVAALSAIPPDRTLVDAHGRSDEAAAWCEALRLEPRLLVRQSELDVRTCDLGELRAWLDPGSALAAGYRLEHWRGATPEHLVPAACVAVTSMADAPMDDADHESPVITPELFRQGEAAARSRLSQFGALVLAPDGAAAGFTELGVLRERPMLGDQGDTVVVAEHRGHRIGRWLKAANLLAALEVHPELRYVETYNAESNPWMLSINEAMGFRPYRSIRLFQGPTAAVLERAAAVVAH